MSNFLNSHIGGSGTITTPNMFIGGLGGLYPTAASMVTLFHLEGTSTDTVEADYINFSIDGSNNISFRFNIDVDLANIWSASAQAALTHFRDLDGKVYKYNSFMNCVVCTDVYLPSTIKIESGAGAHQFPTNNYEYRSIFVPNAVDWGNTTGVDSNMFDSFTSQFCTFYVHASLETINGGDVEADLKQARDDWGCSIKYFSNYTAPSAISDLAVGTVYNDGVSLTWSVPSSTNTIYYYEIYVDGILNNRSDTNSGKAIGLTNLLNYDITVKTVDESYNKTESNSVNQTINGSVSWVDSYLIAYYRLNSDSTDEIAAHDGTDTSMSYGTGKSGQSADFGAGTSSKIDIPDHADFSFTDGSGNDEVFSISLYAKFDSTSNGCLVSKRDNFSTANEWQFMYYNSAIQVNYMHSNGSSYLEHRIPWTPTTGIWYHLVMTYNANETDWSTKFYIDGVIAKTGIFLNTETGTYTGMSNTTADVVLGKLDPVTTVSFSGEMDGVGIWDRELTAEEVAVIHDTQNAGNELT